MKCSPCGKTFTGVENYEQHLECEKHKKNMLCIEQRQINDSSIDSESVKLSYSQYDGTIKCFICDLSFNSLESFQNHSATPEHALKVMLKQKVTSATESSNGTINKHELNAAKCTAESTCKESILPELNDKSYLSYGSCDICSKTFSGPEPYKQHIESQTHKKKVALRQNPSHVVGNIFRCDPCNKSFSGDVPYAQHMCSETHKKKIQNNQFVEKFLSGNSSNSQAGEKDENKLWFCKICQIQCSGLIPYEQHMEGSNHFKNERRLSQHNRNMPQLMNGNHQVDNGKSQSNFVSETNNFNEGNILERPENMAQIMNGSYQNGMEKDVSLSSGISNELKIVSNDELEKLIKIILPDDKINFDEVDIHKDSANEKSDIISSSKNENDDKFRKIHESNENGSADGLKKSEEKKELEIYQICEICNVSLFDKDSAAKHFESKEHFNKRWGS